MGIKLNRCFYRNAQKDFLNSKLCLIFEHCGSYFDKRLVFFIFFHRQNKLARFLLYVL